MPGCGSATTATSGSGRRSTDDTPLTGYDVMMAETDPALVHFELDLYWAWFAHRDPVPILAAFGDRIRQFHVKDMQYVDHKPTFTDPARG